MATTTAPAESEEGEGFLPLLYRGGELLAAGNVTEAKDYLERALSLQPDNERGKNLLGLTYFKLGHFERAAQLYEGLVQENPADPTLRVNLGLVYLKTNELSRAIHEFATATDLAPDHHKAHNYLGLALAQSGQYGKAREHFVLAGSEAMAEKMAQAVAESTAPDSGAELPPQMPSEEIDGALDTGVALGTAATQVDPFAEPALGNAVDPAIDGEEGYAQPSPERAAWEGADGTAGAPSKGVDEVGFNDHPEAMAQERSAARPALVTVFPPTGPLTPLVGSASAGWPQADGTVFPPAAKLMEMAPALRILDKAPTEPFEVRSDLVLITVRDELLTRLSGLLAYGGGVVFKPERKRFRGRLTDRGFGDGPEQMTRANGNGILMLDPNKRIFLATQIGGASAYFREDVVFAFEKSLAFENGRLPSDMTPDLDLVYLRGQGEVLLCLGGPLRSVEVTSVRAVTVPLENMVGWYGSLTPRISILAFDENGKVIRAGVELSGDGFLLFSSPLS
jgi:hypothetical protein